MEIKTSDIENINERLMVKALSDFLLDKIVFQFFLEKYYDFYFDIDDINFKYSKFHSKICEKLDFTGEIINEEDRKFGWINVDEFKSWLNKELKFVID